MPDLVQVVRSAVIDTLSFFHFPVQHVKTGTPPLVDDFANPDQRVTWESWVGSARFGGYMRLPRNVMPSEKLLRRGVGFALLLQDHPARDWLHQTLEAFKEHGELPDLHGQTNPEWHLGPDRLVLSHAEAIVLITLRGLVAQIDTLEALPTPQALGMELVDHLTILELARVALVERARQIEIDRLDRP